MTTKTDIRSAAIEAAAAFIERNPHLYRDAESIIPESLSQRGSALGWIAYFAGYRRPDQCASGVVMNVLGCKMPQEFHWRMSELDTGWRSWFVSWRSNAKRAAWCLRHYAVAWPGELPVGGGLKLSAYP